jgi:RNA polymerase-binding transcription factor DksA
MNKKLIGELKGVLEKEKIAIEKQLRKIAKKDEKLPGDWDTVFPKYDGGESGGAALEKAADEVEEYSTLLPIEHSLEIRLKNIDLALEKIREGTYGKCEKCQKEILVERLKASPESRFCLNCQ